MRKLFLLTLVIAFSALSHAQDKPASELSLNHLALSVKNADQSVDFYKKVFSLREITNKTKVEGIRWLSLGDGKELHLISTLTEEVKVNKAVHMAFSTTDFDALTTILDKMKIAYSDWPGNPNKINIRADGIKQVFFQDPDGYWIEVNSVGQK